MADPAALAEFARRVSPSGRVLVAGLGQGGEALAWLAAHGFEASGLDPQEGTVAKARDVSSSWGCEVRRSDFLMLSLARESYDGIFCEDAFTALEPVGCQRMLATFFQALKPRGVLFAAIDAGSRREEPEKLEGRYLYHPEDFASLLRQNGFSVEAEGQSPARPGRIAYLARRIG